MNIDKAEASPQSIPSDAILPQHSARENNPEAPSLSGLYGYGELSILNDSTEEICFIRSCN